MYSEQICSHKKNNLYFENNQHGSFNYQFSNIARKFIYIKEIKYHRVSI